MKKTIFSFLLSTGLLGVLFSCYCKEVKPFWDVTTIETNVYDVNNNPPISGQINTDSLLIEIELSSRFLSYQAPNNLFINSCQATPKCQTDGHEGMKDKLTDIIITSDQDFNNYTAGQSLSLTTTIDNQSINTWISNQNYNFLIYYFSPKPRIQLLLTEKPTNLSTHNFTVKMVFDSGRTVETQTGAITWN